MARLLALLFVLLPSIAFAARLGPMVPIVDPPRLVSGISFGGSVAAAGETFGVAWDDGRQMQFFGIVDRNGVAPFPTGLLVDGLTRAQIAATDTTFFLYAPSNGGTRLQRVRSDGTLAGALQELPFEPLDVSCGAHECVFIHRSGDRYAATVVTDDGVIAASSAFGPSATTDSIVTVSGGSARYLVAGVPRAAGGPIWTAVLGTAADLLAFRESAAVAMPGYYRSLLTDTNGGWLLVLPTEGNRAVSCSWRLQSFRFNTSGELTASVVDPTILCSHRDFAPPALSSGAGRTFFSYWGFNGRYGDSNMLELTTDGRVTGSPVPLTDGVGDLVGWNVDAAGRLLLVERNGTRRVAPSFPLLPPRSESTALFRYPIPNYVRHAATAPDGSSAVITTIWYDESYAYTPLHVFYVSKEGKSREVGTIASDRRVIGIVPDPQGAFDIYLGRIDRYPDVVLLRRRLMPDGILQNEEVVVAASQRWFHPPIVLSSGTLFIPSETSRGAHELRGTFITNGVATERFLASLDLYAIYSFAAAETESGLFAAWTEAPEGCIATGCEINSRLLAFAFGRNGEVIDSVPQLLHEEQHGIGGAVATDGTSIAAVIGGVLRRYDSERHAVDDGVLLAPLGESAGVFVTVDAYGLATVGEPSPRGRELRWTYFRPTEPLSAETLVERSSVLLTDERSTRFASHGKSIRLFTTRYPAGQPYGYAAQTFMADLIEERPPLPAVNLQATLHGSDVHLAWSDRSSDEEGFALEHSRDGREFLEVGRLGAGTTAAIVRDLDFGRHYFRLRAYSSGGWSEPTNVVTVEVIRSQEPLITAVRASGTRALEVNWLDRSDDESRFVVEAWSDGRLEASIGAPSSVQSATLSGLRPGATYQVRVGAVISGGQIRYSAATTSTLPSGRQRSVRP